MVGVDDERTAPAAWQTLAVFLRFFSAQAGQQARRETLQKHNDRPLPRRQPGSSFAHVV
jgi:hypothetical protein